MVKIQVNSQGKAYYTTSGKALKANAGSATIEELNVIPSTSAQIINADDNVDGYAPINVSAVTSAIDNNIRSDNIKNGVQILGVTGSYEGTGTIDVVLKRFSDDSGTEIGTHYMNFKDNSNNVFKVICLDSQYRLASGQYSSTANNVTNLPSYADLATSNAWEAKETATTNTQLILNWCSANGYTSTACSHCRSKSFTINGTTYYGQLPNMIEVIHIAKHYHEFDSLDTSASSYTSLNFSASRNIWSSTQANASLAWFLVTIGNISFSKTDNLFVTPILEIPIN